MTDYVPTPGPWRALQDDETGHWVLYGRRNGLLLNNPNMFSNDPLGVVYKQTDAQVIVEALTLAKAIYEELGEEMLGATPTLLEMIMRSMKRWKVTDV